MSSNIQSTEAADSMAATGKWLALSVIGLYLFFPVFILLSHVALFSLVALFIRNFDRRILSSLLRAELVLCVFVALYLIVIVGVFYTTAESDFIRQHLIKYARFLYPVVIVYLLWDKKNLQECALNSFLAGMTFILVSTWLNLWFVLPWSASKTPGWGQNHFVIGDHITQNVMMAFYTVAVLSRAMQAEQAKKKILWAILALMAAISITHLSHGRTGSLLLIFALLAFVLANYSGRRAVLLIGVTTTLLSVAIWSSDAMQLRISQAINEAKNHAVDNQSSIGHRLYNYKITPELIREAPIVGHGTGAYHNEICRFLERSDWCDVFHGHPHNQFLFLGADHGLIGIALYVMLIIAMFRLALKTPAGMPRSLLICLTVMLLFDSLINTPFYSSRESQFFSYMAALLIAMCHLSSRLRNVR